MNNEGSNPGPPPVEPTFGLSSKVRFALVLLLLFLYVALLGWAGFVLCTVVLGTAMMMILGARTGAAMINTLILVLLVKGLFGWALKVPLPKGEWGLPF